MKMIIDKKVFEYNPYKHDGIDWQNITRTKILRLGGITADMECEVIKQGASSGFGWAVYRMISGTGEDFIIQPDAVLDLTKEKGVIKFYTVNTNTTGG